jgi:hypothetical protein
MRICPEDAGRGLDLGGGASFQTTTLARETLPPTGPPVNYGISGIVMAIRVKMLHLAGLAAAKSGNVELPRKENFDDSDARLFS